MEELSLYVLELYYPSRLSSEVSKEVFVWEMPRGDERQLTAIEGHEED